MSYLFPPSDRVGHLWVIHMGVSKKHGDRLLSDNTTLLDAQHSGKLLSDFEPWSDSKKTRSFTTQNGWNRKNDTTLQELHKDPFSAWWTTAKLRKGYIFIFIYLYLYIQTTGTDQENDTYSIMCKVFPKNINSLLSCKNGSTMIQQGQQTSSPSCGFFCELIVGKPLVGELLPIPTSFGWMEVRQSNPRLLSNI